jgi:short-subunit dehydrogenase
VTLVVLGTVDSPYWEHNPGSREHLPASNPRLVPTLTCEEAAEAIYTGVEERRRTIVRPSIFRVLLVLNALAPGLVASQLRRAARKSASDRA